MATTYLTQTISSGNQRTFTISVWVKRSALDAGAGLGSEIITYAETPGSADARGEFFMRSDDTLGLGFNPTSSSWSSFYTTSLYRDVSGWYHLVAKVDTTQSVDTDRLKLYVNGVAQSFTGTLPILNFDTGFNVDGYTYQIGRNAQGESDYWNGLMSHFYFIDGTAYDASTFGETDSDTGEWKIITSPSVTMGTNGFTILKDGNTITDQSTNSNNFTLGAGTLTNTEDCPSDVYATQNPLQSASAGGITYTFANGNTTVECDGSVGNNSTLGASKGKFYCEGKLISFTNSGAGPNVYQIGIRSLNPSTNLGISSSGGEGWVYQGTGEKDSNNSSSSFGDTYTTDDIIGVAMDLDNNKLYFAKNGTWQNSGDPTSGATGTGAAYTITAPASTTDGYYFFACGHQDNKAKWSLNYGNGYFGTTIISSAGTNASNIGIFEYDVPTGYTALSTKGLQE